MNLLLITRKNCEACTIMRKVLTDVLETNNVSLSLAVNNVDEIAINNLEKLNITAYPTLLIKEDGKEMARLEGTYSKEYIMGVINKLKLLCLKNTEENKL